jgi:hypothetical protein
VVDREMQVAAVVKWVCGKQCGAVVNALKGGTGALIARSTSTSCEQAQSRTRVLFQRNCL